jgi:hypothetical protein
VNVSSVSVIETESCATVSVKVFILAVSVRVCCVAVSVKI